MPRSLSARLALSALAITAVWVVVLTVGFDVALSLRLRSNADDVLRTRASAVATTISVQPDGSFVVRDPPRDSALDTGVWIFRGTDLVEGPTGEEKELDVSARSLAQQGELFRTTAEPRAERFFALPVVVDDVQVGTVVAALDLDPYRRTEDLVQLASAALGLLLLLVVYFSTRVAIARALRPVEQMAGQAADWSAEDADRRFGSATRPQELELLAERLDGVLDRLSAVLRREQQLTGELSHELRTPLTRIMGEAELALRPGRSPERMRTALTTVLHDSDSMQRILETLLTTARSDSGARGRSECLPVLEKLATTHSREHVTVTVDSAPGLWVGVAAEVLERTVAPLLDNAQRFAASSVQITAVRRGDHVSITVLDDGPGVDPEIRDDPFAAGRRTEDGHGGAGLGLALARRLAVSGGGDLALLPSAGGAVFEVTLPPG